MAKLLLLHLDLLAGQVFVQLPEFLILLSFLLYSAFVPDSYHPVERHFEVKEGSLLLGKLC